MRSAYHVRELEVYRLLRLRQPLDVFLSHDWPQGIARHGDLNRLLQRKSFLRQEVRGLGLTEEGRWAAGADGGGRSWGWWGRQKARQA